VTEPSYQTEDVLVYDDVLSSGSFSKLFQHLGGLDYRSVHHSGWRKVWRLHDGDPLRSTTVWYWPGEREKAETGTYPTGSAIDELISWVADREADIAGVVGHGGVEWVRLSFTPWIYPAGSGLSLHQDGSSYSGAFTYFAHQEWRLHWGGQLLVLDPRTRSRQASPSEIGRPFLDDRQESLRAFEPGFALAVFPKPNRIAFLSPTALHLLTRVDPNAGQAARLSVAGFFHRSA